VSSYHEVKDGCTGDEAGHGVHGVVVEERTGVDGSLRHDGHQLVDGQGLGLDEALSTVQPTTKLLQEEMRVHLGQHPWDWRR